MVDTHIVDKKQTFSSFSHLLDARILRALADMGFARPTLVQAKAIPLALESRDILARARTGSGKTAAYCIPVVQKILSAKSCMPPSDAAFQSTRALILVPTRELAEQVSACLRSLVVYCEKEVFIANIAAGATTHLQRTLLADKPDIVISTPARALGLLQSKALSLLHLDAFVIDEADLILSYGHDEDIQAIFQGGVNGNATAVVDNGSALTSGTRGPSTYLPKVYQSFLMSATMTDDVEVLKRLALRNPAILKLEEGEAEASSLTQYYVRTSEVDKFLLTYVILKLRLIQGKTLIFVSGVERAFRLRLFLEQFGIRSCVLNSEMPLNARYHTVQEFNKGVYEYIIASDESADYAEPNTDEEGQSEHDDEAGEGGENDANEEKGEEQGNEQEDIQEDGQEFEDTVPTQRNVLVDPHIQDQTQSRTKKRKRGSNSSPQPAISEVSVSKKSHQSNTTNMPQKSGINSIIQPSKLKKSKTKRNNPKEYAPSRGIDFHALACVLNFDLPTSSRAYTHRIGRTARAGRSGTALSYVVPQEEFGRDKVVGGVESTRRDEHVWGNISRKYGEMGTVVGNAEQGKGNTGAIKEYKFDMRQVEAFRYRMEDALRTVTRSAIKEARIKELKAEILNSERLKAHFEDNPLDLEYLRHDKPLHPARVQPHMKHVPKYLLPRATGPPISGGSNSILENRVEDPAAVHITDNKPGFVPFKKTFIRGRGRDRRNDSRPNGVGRGGGGGYSGKKKSNPLRKFC